MLVPFSVMAAIMAFLITYHEMRVHYTATRRPVREALRTAVLVLIFFLILSWFAAVLLLPEPG